MSRIVISTGFMGSSLAHVRTAIGAVVVGVAIVGASLGAGSAFAERADVRVGNPPQDAVNDATGADTMPFAVTKAMEGNAGNPNFTFPISLSIPAGFRLIIDQISLRVDLLPRQRAIVEGLIGNPANLQHGIRLPIPIEKQMTLYIYSTPQFDILAGSTAAHVAVDPGQAFAVSVLKSKPAGTFFGVITLQGHLVALPPARSQ